MVGIVHRTVEVEVERMLRSEKMSGPAQHQILLTEVQSPRSLQRCRNGARIPPKYSDEVAQRQLLVL